MIRRGMTRAQEEKMRADNRRKEYQREDNKRLVAQERMMRANVACEERVENKRFIRRLQQVRIIPHKHVYLLVCLFVCCEGRRKWRGIWKRGLYHLKGRGV